MEHNYDFAGWATRNNLQCSDGRTIRQNAFAHQDGMVVPLVWNHQHGESENVLGHALLENRDDGVYAYCSFNDTDSGQNAKKLVLHGDVTNLSICANKLKQQGGDVLHGIIREVSLVLAGANPGANIESVISHSDGEEEAAIFSFVGKDYGIEISHSDEDNEETNIEEEIEETPKEDEKENKEEKPEDKKDDKETEDEADNDKIEHADKSGEKEKNMADNEKTVQDVWDGMTEEQQKVCEFLTEQALIEAGAAEGDEEMNHNVFDGDNNNDEMLTHADMAEIFDTDWKRFGSLKEAVANRIEDGQLMHAVYDDDGNEVTYGIANIDYLFPEAKTINNEPDFIKRNQEWVGRVMAGVHHTPFSRIKSIYANITMDEARAKGYIKGKLKKEEVFSLLKRTTTPQTVYKKQKLDKDDIHDITDFDVVAWLKREMRMMLDEELARAFLIGDGRLADDDDKIDPTHIRPIWIDEELYVINKVVTLPENATNDQIADAIIDAVITGQEDYEGSGSPLMFTEKSFLTRALLMRNGIGERKYKNKAELASEMDVSDIVPVPVFKNQTRVVEGTTRKLSCIVVNLNDYNVGADKGGSVDMFDDFDIDRNQMKYLIETRCSGALIKPYSAIVVELVFQ